MNNQRLIYSLNCPFTDEIVYIGKSTQGIVRPLQHLTNSHSDKIKEWVKNLEFLNNKPVVKIIKTLKDWEDLDACEKYYINYYTSKGALLLNKTLVKPVTVLPDLDKSDPSGIESISLFIKNRRKKAGLTQEGFAERSGVALTVIRKIEQGKTNIQLDGLIKVLSMFGVKIDIKSNRL